MAKHDEKKPIVDNKTEEEPLEEQKAPEMFAKLTLTEKPFGESVWEHYEKVKHVEEGGSGDIWTVQKKGNDDHRLYAMKEIDKNFFFGSCMKELRNEIEVLRKIDHPNVVRILEIFETKEFMYLIMEYCSGGNLWARKNYSEEDAANIMFEVLSAVALCHKQKVVHRDIKFENIMFESKESKSVRLIDFGTSQQYKQPREEYTMKLQVGTTYSIAPEVFEGQYSEKADIWSCGVVAFMLLSNGELPFDAPTKQGIPEVVLRGYFSFEGKEWEGVSDEAKEFVSSLLEYDAEKRWTAEECLTSSWLKHKGVDRIASTDNVPTEVKDALVQCDEDLKLKRLAKMIIAHNTPASKLESLREAFESMDKSHDGTISMREFKSTLCRDSNYSDEELEELFSELDQSDTGVINYTEFLSATLETESFIDEQMIDEAFDRLDAANDGKLSVEGLGELLDSKKSPIDGEVLAKEILAEVPGDEKSEVKYDEFVDMFQRTSP